MNTDEKKTLEEVDQLVNELVDGVLSKEKRSRLSALLIDNLAMQTWYRNWMTQHASLHFDFHQGKQELLPPLCLKEASREPFSRPSSTLADGRSGYLWKLTSPNFVLGALAASILITVVYLSSGSYRDSEYPREVSADVVQSNIPSHDDSLTGSFGQVDGTTLAILTQVFDASWSDTDVPTNVGAAMSSGRYILESGVVSIELLSGASIIVEAPCEFGLLSALRAKCYYGKIRIKVPPPAHGFSIDTPTHRAVDLGTEFAVHVDEEGQSEFHVLDGEIELYEAAAVQAGDPIVLLKAGFSARSIPGGQLAEMTPNGADFMDFRQLLDLAKGNQSERYARWQNYSRQLAANPHVLLYYGFDGHEPWHRIVHNDGPATNELLNGAIIGCHWTTGRWPEKQALEFKRTGDRVRFNVPGEFDSLTFATWVRLEGFDRWLSSLMLTEAHELGEPHWQFTQNGAMRLGVRIDEDGDSYDYNSPPVLGPSDLGRWVHLACTYDGARSRVTHFVDARVVSSHEIEVPCKIRIGAADLGNWTPSLQHRDYLVRSLNGLMDEFVIWDRALSESEIQEMYLVGKPTL